MRAQADTATASSTRWSGAREPDTRLKQTEVLITVVRFDEPKLLNGSDQKVSGQVLGSMRSSTHGRCTTGPQAQPYPGMLTERNEVRLAVSQPHTPLRTEGVSARNAHGAASQG